MPTQGTFMLVFLLTLLSYIAQEMGSCMWLAKMRTLDLLTPLMAPGYRK